MRGDFGKGYIVGELEALGREAERYLELYLIGGGAMAFRGLKDATKDIDVVTGSDADFEGLVRVLKGMGYRSVQEPGTEYVELGAMAVLENGDGCRFDLFNGQVVEKLFFSDGMAARSEPLERTGDLEFRAASLEDIFLFKSVAGRETDLDDMNTLVQAGLDFDTVREELENQVSLRGEETFVTYVDQTLIELEEKYGVTLPLHRDVEEISERVYDELEVIHALEGETTVADLGEEIELDSGRLKRLLMDLEDKGVVAMAGDRVRRIGDRP